MIIDLGSAAAPYVTVLREGEILGCVSSIDTEAKTVTRYVHAQAYTETYDEIRCSASAPDFVCLIPGMQVGAGD